MRDRLTWFLLAVLIAACASAARAQSPDHDRIVALEYEVKDAQDVAGVVTLLNLRLQRIEDVLGVVQWVGMTTATVAVGLAVDAIRRRLK